MEIKNAEFFTSVADARSIKDYNKDEIAFVGRSNVGKSSLINALTMRRKLAVTSSLPGRTRLVNYFKINGELFFVDLPGYGYAKASKTEQAKWKSLIEAYLERAKKLKLVFVLMDIRREPSDLDAMMLNYLYYKNIPFKVLATKSDKLSNAQINKQISLISGTLGLGIDDIIITSAEKKLGIDKVLNTIDTFLEKVEQ